jgi:hypothetical protein
MDFTKINTQELLSYSTILENIITSNMGIQREIQNAVSGQLCTREEMEKIYIKSLDSHKEADEAYSEIQKELDLRMKRDLRMKFGIKRTQSIINEFDDFVSKKNEQLQKEKQELDESIKKIANETVANLKIVEDDNSKG